jgi:serine phosphatase RsbU (regulator of sigma subunit)/PAS domain-containing protein
MAEASGRGAANDAVAGLRSRSAALRQAAASPDARRQELLDAALAELDGAIHALTAGGNGAHGPGRDDQAGGAHSDRRLLHAVFAQAPVALLVVDQDSTVRRANSAACELLGVGPGYATGKTLASMVEPASQAALRSQLAAALRSGSGATVGCSLMAATGTVRCELGIRVLSLRGEEDRLLVALAAQSGSAGEDPLAAKAEPRNRARSADRSKASEAFDQEITALTRRSDLLLAAACLLLDNAAASESVILQRCARLLAGDVATWVIVDVRRRGALRRHFVAGPDDPTSARLTQAIAAVTPDQDAVSFRVCESGSSVLLTHIEDEEMLGRDGDGSPLLARLGGVSVLSVPVTDDSRSFGALTLVKNAAAGAFELPDVGLVEQVADLLARAISARRLLTRQTEAAEALRSSLLPPVLRAVPGVEIVAAHMPPTRGREVGGDFYDVYPTPQGWGVAIGDVCGKGDDAAAATATARHAIRVLSHWNPDPGEVLRGANEIMMAEEFGSRFVTADAAHLSWDNRTLRVLLASAGHPGPVLLSPDGGAQVLTGGGVALGIFPDPEPATQELRLEAGDVLFFFTDGLTGARSPQQTYLEEILTDRLGDLTGRPAAEVVSEMRRVVLEFSDGVLRDDLTMLALRVGLPPES